MKNVIKKEQLQKASKTNWKHLDSLGQKCKEIFQLLTIKILK